MNPNLHRRIVALARRQHGNVTRQQLLRLGLDEEAIKYQVRIGLLFRVHRGVYAVGRPPTTALEKAAAAVLACGPGAALSHRAALALWGYTDRWPSWCDVTVPRDCRRSGIAVHRTASLQRWDVRIHQGIRVTSPAWTLVDCAPDLSVRAQARAVNQALRSKHLKRWQLAELIERRKNRPATGRLHRFVADTGGPTRSELEDTFLEFCERYGLPQPRTNTIVAGREADAYFDAES
jgi:predicted transcriptional regulator of viral defense system